VVAAAVVVHGLAIALVVAGLAVHLTMAVVIADERPALRSMITGRIDLAHAARHSAKWVAKAAANEPHPGAPGAPDAKEE
jgi:cytochrome b subunit of formate dehydrogenase